MNKTVIIGITLLVLLTLGLNACEPAPVIPTPTPIDMDAIYTAAVQTTIAELTRIAPTYTPTPTNTPPITNTATITPTETPAKLSLETNLAIYFTNVIDPQTCKYETLPIPINHGFSGDMETDVRLAASYLLNTKWESSGYLTNPLATSNLYSPSTEVIGTELKITLEGTISRHDDQCLNEQARDQLWATVWTAVRRYEQPVITDISIWVDIFLFDDVMLKG